MEHSTKPAPGLHFHIANLKDAPRLIPMINRAFAVEEFMGGTRTDTARLANVMSKGQILMAEDEQGRLVGSLFMEFRAQSGYLGMLAVEPARQRQGVAHQLTAEAERRFRAAGLEKIEIIVLNMRPELLPVYRSWGFVEAGMTEFQPSRPIKPGVEIHGIRMEKRL
ncbi:MAG: GNAT family N-acetyltransferase [Terracidiphilus sp.]|nr:GNAT family N-acetyltransferase [Terracidiphilus sp.]